MNLPDSVPGHFVQPIDYWVTPRLAAGTQPMGFPPVESRSITPQGGRSGSSYLWSTTGFKPRGRYNLIQEVSDPPLELSSYD